MDATIGVPSQKNPARRASGTRGFAATRRGVLALADWLRAWQVPAVVMEATGDYWKGPFYRLEAEGLECVLADAKQVKQLPGRPGRDPSDAAWPAARFERGAVRPCFVAAPEFRLIREHTRYRRDLTGERTREKQRAEKLPESAAVKLSSVVTGLHGVTGRDIMDHLIAGERDPGALAQLARGRARRKITDLEHALEGAEFFTPGHAALPQAMLERTGRVNAEIAGLSRVIERLLARYEEQGQQAEAGARVGTPRRRGRPRRDRRGHEPFPHPRPPGLPGRAHPARQPVRQARRQQQAQEGQPVPGRDHRPDRRPAGKTDTREGARYRKIARSRGTAKACVAAGNTQMRVCRKLLSSPGTRHDDLGPDYYERNTARQVSHHVARLTALGYQVTLCRRPEPDPAAGTQTA
jgi:transposase